MALITEETPHRPRSLPAAAWIALLTAAAMAGATGVVLLVRALGGDFTDLLRDPAAQFDIPVYAGAISTLGAMLLGCTAAVTLLAGLKAAGGRVVLLAVAGLSAVMALDDLFLLHEYLAPRVFGIPEKAVLAGYALAFAALFWLHAVRGAPGPRWGFYLACGLLGLSAATDMVMAFSYRTVFVEDIAKFGGFTAWCAYWFHVSLRALR